MQKKRNSLVKTLVAGALLLTVSFATAQQQVNNWRPVFEKEVRTGGQRVIIPSKYRTFRVGDDFKSVLFSAPHENTVSLQTSPVIIDLPMPDGTLQQFRVVEAPIMEAPLAAQFPGIKTFSVVGVDQLGTYGKLDWTEFGFHGMLFASGERIFIDPYSRDNIADYISYYASDFSKEASQRMMPECGATDIGNDEAERIASPPPSVLANIWAGSTLRTYRFAVACTGEYAVAATGVGTPTTAQILSVVTTSVNRVDGVYETEAAIRLVLVANETAILFGNAASDPFNGNNNAGTLINESQTVITNAITNANYDIGHTFSTGGGGLAGLGVVCTSGQKARGITGSPNPVGDPYDIDYVAHEVGHQFSGNHSYNQCTGNATQNAGTMVEPGGGVTIMGYAGICAAADNIAMNSIAYFHTISFDEIMTFSNTGNGNTCPVKPSTGNTIPVVTGSANYTIPRMTPFTLTGSATDADGDALTYSWEQFDNNSTNHAVGTASPYFRSLVPSTSPSRTFPRMATVLTGATSNLGEYLPNAAQTLNFRLTARDNRMGGGGVRYAANQVTIAASGPFSISAPNTTGITWASSSTQTVTWNVNSTNTAPVSCANVRLLLSTDGGATYPTVILASTPNDGSQAITVPPQATTITTCRIKAEAIGNIFFDVNDNNFTITASAAPIATVTIAQTTGSNPMCPGANAVFTATPFNGGTAPTYQWQVNGTNVGTGATYTTTTLTNGQVVTCIMTSNLSGVVGNPATSNAITMTVGSTVPSVVIAGPAVLCAGATATYTATPTNGGSSPTYQWQVSGTNAGTNSATFASSALTNGQTVTCTMTSNAGCQATPTVTSNTITVTVNSSAALPFSQNFEAATFPPTGWVLQNADNGAVAWGTAGAKGLVRRAAAGNTGSANGSAALNCFEYNTDTTQVDNLISVPVNLAGAGNPRMTFKRAYKYYNDGTNPSNFHDELRVYISTDCGSTFGPAVYFKKGVQLASNGTINTAFTPAVAADWDTDTISLSAYTGQSVIVKFEVTNRYGQNLYLDDINITSTSAAPVANFTSAATKCAGQAIAFTDASTNTPTSWNWSTTPSTGVTITSATSQNPTITFATAGTYTVSHTATNSVGTSPSFTQAVTVNATPSMTSAGTIVICSGSAVNLALTANVASTFSWIAAATANVTGESTTAQSSSTITNTLTVTSGSLQPVNYSVTPTATASGCAATTPQVVTVTVRALPTVTANSTPASGNVCTGSQITLTGGGATTYTWTGGATNGVAFTPAASGTYTVTGTDANGCTNTATKVVTLVALPTVTANSTPASGNVCTGSQITLTGGGAATYTWTGGATNGVAFTPAASGTYTVTGTNAGGCTNTATKVVTLLALPTVTANSTPASGNVCTGSQITLTGGGATTYTWTGGASNGVAFTPAASGTYTVTGTGANGCTNTATKAVTLLALPTVTANSTPASGNVCAGSQITLTGGGAATYTWTGGATNGVAFTPAASGTYTVTGTGANGCTNTATKVVTLNALPNVTVNSPSTCAGSPVTLTAGGATTYTWNPSGSGASISVSPTVNSSYTVTGTNVNGCVNTAISNVTITSAPNVTANSVSICAGQSATITGSGASTYSWSNGDATASSTVSPATTTSYTVTGSNGPGCSNTAIATVTVNALPDASIGTPSSIDCINSTVTLSGSSMATGAAYQWTSGPATAAYVVSAPGSYTLTVTDANGCSATAVTTVTANSALPNLNIAPPAQLSCTTTTVTLTGSSSTPGVSYQWTSGPATATYAVSAAGSYTLTVTDPANGCASTGVATVTTNTTLVNVTAGSSATGTVCGGTTVTLNAGGADTYVWDDASTNATHTVSPAVTTTYSVTGTDANGCIGTASVTVNVFAPNVPVVSQSGTTLTASSAVSYQWYFNGSPMPGETSQTLNVTQNGSYTVETIDANGCTNTSTGFTVANIGIKDVTMNASISIYPNPNNGSFQVKGSLDSGSDYTLELRNTLGQLLQQETIKNTASFERAFSLQTTEAGVYFIILRNTAGASSVHRVVIE